MTKKRQPAISFQAFWDEYGLKRDRFAAERQWRRLSASEQRAAYKGIAAYRDDCQRSGIAMMYAQGYLSHRRWEDDIEPQQPALEEMILWD